MKYILKYETKSKYFGFKKENYKEFENTFDMFVFIANIPIHCDYKVYEQKEIEFTEMIGEDKNEKNNSCR